jgi:hypothetical protein
MSAVKVTGPRSRTLDLGNGRPMTSRDAGKASGAKPGDALAAHSFWLGSGSGRARQFTQSGDCRRGAQYPRWENNVLQIQSGRREVASNSQRSK